MDFLLALRLARALRWVFRLTQLGLLTIYQSPIVLELAGAISRTETTVVITQTCNIMASLLDTYRQLIPETPIPDKTASSAHVVGAVNVLLTGSTGTLGSMFLRSLLNRPNMSHVFCLNRAPDGGRSVQKEVQATSNNKTADFSTDNLETSVRFI
ncbi:hypothetical protein B0I35DRAFT_424125 [Stachybotrys elegans]|uniref:Thioester reductase (TE) domain-containing protein n=1 Tax=Stachybotrys elegans TaxID=80388 RepID=A0A8K0SW10_9HYPO|nr:hypothetical protein B0I35DRAFT_424125 [Stachybotrys elegans]